MEDVNETELSAYRKQLMSAIRVFNNVGILTSVAKHRLLMKLLNVDSQGCTESMRVSGQQQRADETPERRQARLQSSVQQQRADETPDQRQARLQSMRVSDQ